MYIYIHMYINMYMYVYIYTQTKCKLGAHKKAQTTMSMLSMHDIHKQIHKFMKKKNNNTFISFMIQMRTWCM